MRYIFKYNLQIGFVFGTTLLFVSSVVLLIIFGDSYSTLAKYCIIVTIALLLPYTTMLLIGDGKEVSCSAVGRIALTVLRMQFRYR